MTPDERYAAGWLLYEIDKRTDHEILTAADGSRRRLVKFVDGPYCQLVWDSNGCTTCMTWVLAAEMKRHVLEPV